MSRIQQRLRLDFVLPRGLPGCPVLTTNRPRELSSPYAAVLAGHCIEKTDEVVIPFDIVFFTGSCPVPVEGFPQLWHRPPYRSASAGLMPPRPRPSIGPTERPASHFRSSDMNPERPPGYWQPRAFAVPSQRPVLPRTRPPPSKSQAEDPLERAAEMFRNPASASGSNKPAAPSSASVADLQKTTAPKAPGPSRLPEASCCSSDYFN